MPIVIIIIIEKVNPTLELKLKTVSCLYCTALLLQIQNDVDPFPVLRSILLSKSCWAELPLSNRQKVWETHNGSHLENTV